MNPILNFDPATYEAIIFAFVVLGLIQSFALRRKWQQAESLKRNISKVAQAGVKALLATIASASKSILKLSIENTMLKREVDEWQREAMEAAADRNEARDALAAHNNETPERGPRPNDPSAIFEHLFGGEGDGGIRPDGLVASFTLGPDGVLKPLDAESAAFAARTGITAEDILNGNGLGDGYTSTIDRGDRPAFSASDLLESLRSIQRRRPGHDPLNDLLFGGSPFGSRFARGGFVPGEVETQNAAAARDFGPDSGAENRKADLSGSAQPVERHDESCDTQRPSFDEPRSYPSSSPRAG